MDALTAMLDPKRSLASMQKTAVGGLVRGRIIQVEPEEESQSDEDVQDAKDYAKEYQLAEEARYQNASQIPNLNTDSCSMMDVDSFRDMQLKGEGGQNDDESDPGEANQVQQRADDIYSRYKFDLNTTTIPLPIASSKQEILTLLNAHNVIIVQGQTGCGKTTQVPQYILDQARDRHEYCNIAVTQPRKIAAISVARRVCEERGWTLGTVCGFKVGLKKVFNADTILTYMTSGVLLQKVVYSQSLNEFTHIILDEVHERDQDLDFLMLVVRKFLHLNSPKVKVILMSATFDTDKYANYFLTHTHFGRSPAPTIFIPKNYGYQTHIYYANQLPNFQWPLFDEAHPCIELVTYHAMVNLCKLFSKLDDRDQVTRKVRIGSVLIFLPGIFEIEEAYRFLSDEMKRNSVSWEIIPLHSSITQEQQQRVFNPPSDGHRKIILSTNIAESSITVADIEYVIDFCLTKTMVVDPETHFSTLKMEWASHVNCVQRAGRVGRVCDGRVYRLVPEDFYDHSMKAVIDPEILRAPLDKLVLSCKKLKLHDPPKAILALALDPPELKNIESTILALKEAGALLVTCRGIEMMSDGDMTFLGEIMSCLPLDVRMSKLIVLGYMFSCLDQCVVMAAGCSLSNVFATPFQEKLKAYCNILPWADGSCSDLIAHFNLFKVFKHNKRKRFFNNRREEQLWGQKHFVSLRSLAEWEMLIQEIHERLQFLGIREEGGSHAVRLTESETTLFVKIAICGAFYPNYFVRSCEAGQIDEELALRTLNSHDPFRSVYFSNMDPALPGPLYSKSIRDLLADCSPIVEVFFYGAKVVATFGDSPHTNFKRVDGTQLVSSMSDRINTDVYKAVRKRQISRQQIFYAASVAESWEVAELNGYSNDPRKNKSLKKKIISVEGEVLPTLDVQFIYIKLSNMMDAGHFWVINTAEVGNLERIRRQLNGELPALEKLTNHKNIVGHVYAMLMDNEYKRAKVRSLQPVRNSSPIADVLLIDSGVVRADVPLDSLYVIPAGCESARWPGQAIECVLANIQPSLVMDSCSVWHKDATKYIQDTLMRVCIGKIYSVLNNVVRLELFSGPNNKLSINQELITKGFALFSEESFLSKERHSIRDKVQQYSEDPQICMLEFGAADGHQDPIEIRLPGYLELRNRVALTGPFSPLEMQIFSVLKNGQGKQARIEGTSVNSVLLDTDPQDPHERLVVASYVGLHASNHSLTLRHTTLMPNIHGFPALMALLFCRSMELKPTELGTHYAELLCGLGKTTLRRSGMHAESERSIFPSHDLLLTLDTEVTFDDIESINVLRYWMNQSINAMQANYQNQNMANTMMACQTRMKTHMIELLKGRVRRKSLVRQHVKDSDKWGKFAYQGRILKATDDCSTAYDVWPLHCAIELEARNQRHAEVEMEKEEMLNYAKNEKALTEYICKFCKVKIESVPELRLHMASAAHKTKVNDYLLE